MYCMCKGAKITRDEYNPVYIMQERYSGDDLIIRWELNQSYDMVNF